MQPLRFPAFDHKIRTAGAGAQIFDVVRKKYVRLTPEEWVRQHCLHYLMGHLAYPRALMRLERAVWRSGLRHRPDLVVCDRLARPLLLVECKAPGVPLTAKTQEQLVRYNAHCKARLLLMTNGLQHFCWQLDYAGHCSVGLQAIPHFSSLSASLAQQEA